MPAETRATNFQLKISDLRCRFEPCENRDVYVKAFLELAGESKPKVAATGLKKDSKAEFPDLQFESFSQPVSVTFQVKIARFFGAGKLLGSLRINPNEVFGGAWQEAGGRWYEISGVSPKCELFCKLEGTATPCDSTLNLQWKGRSSVVVNNHLGKRVFVGAGTPGSFVLHDSAGREILEVLTEQKATLHHGCYQASVRILASTFSFVIRGRRSMPGPAAFVVFSIENTKPEDKDYLLAEHGAAQTWSATVHRLFWEREEVGRITAASTCTVPPDCSSAPVLGVAIAFKLLRKLVPTNPAVP